jgi:Cd2+/Zn2+-exporting ATPase/Cu+-exporting ATPase
LREHKDRIAALSVIGQAAEGRSEPGGAEHPSDQTCGWTGSARIALVALAAAAAWFRFGEPVPHVSLIGIIGIVVGGWPIVREAAKNIAARRMTMELSMSIAIVAAAAISEFFTALIITLFVLVAEVLENMTASRGRRAIRDLLEFLPHTVTVRSADGIRQASADEIRVGDSVLVNPGGLVPVDGLVLSGHSFVDQARITGESLPAEKMPGAIVYAGTINQSGALEVRVQRMGRDTSYGGIIKAVEEAEYSRAPAQQLADQLAGYVVYFALAAAAATFIITRDLRSTISVVIVAGACGVAAGTPLAIVGGIGRAARLGAIIKGGLYLETLGKVDTVVLDKTGTLTFGLTRAQSVVPAAGNSEADVLESAASAELRSEHPLGKAIVKLARERGVAGREPELFEYTLGQGIAAVVSGDPVFVGNRDLLEHNGIELPTNLVRTDRSSEIFVARRGRFIGTIALADTIRPEARQAMEALRRMGIRPVLLSGDNQPVADAVASELGIGEVEGNLLPAIKLARIRNLIAEGCVVAMIGDGINDAPSLAQANVGVAMGSGTDVARESADVVLLGNDLMKFSETVAIARWTRRIICQNFTGTIVVDLAGMVMAAAGLLHPTLAAFIHVASEMTFILNSARLLPRADRCRDRVGLDIDPQDKAIAKAA